MRKFTSLLLLGFALGSFAQTPGGVSGSELWFKTAPLNSDLQGYYRWQDFSGDSIRLMLLDSRGVKSELTLPNSSVHYFNFNPSLWLADGFRSLSASLKLKIVYTQADLRTIFDITPELFDKGLISHSLDSIIVVSDMKFSKFFDTINSLKKTSEIHPSINVRAKIIFYLNEQILNTYYLGMFYIYCQNGIYEVNEEFRNMINAIIKKSGKLPMY